MPLMPEPSACRAEIAPGFEKVTVKNLCEEDRLADNKILIISYLFPPVGGIGVQRALSLAKYLPGCGYQVHILKATNAGGPVYDPDLTRQIPPAVQVHQAFTPEIPFRVRQWLWARLAGNKGSPKIHHDIKARSSWWKRTLTSAIKRVLCPEPEIVWIPFAVRKARRIIRRHKIDTVLVTVPPFSALLAGSALKRKFPSLTLVSDFRDEWLSFYLKDFEFQNSDYARRRAETIEREAVKRSDLVVAVNRSSRDEIRHRYPNEPDAKFVVIPNGYDPETFAGFKARAHESNYMIVTHVGTVYKTASPSFYLAALNDLPGEMRSRIETRFIGRISESERALIESQGSGVKVVGFIPQAAALNFMEETDYLLLTMTNEISVPGKLFEYMAAGKPILAVTPSGSEVDLILKETAAGVCARPDDSASIKAMLIGAFEAWRKGLKLVDGNNSSIRRYERPILVEEYGRIIRQAGPAHR